MSLISVVIVTRDRREQLTALLSDLAGTASEAGDQITVVDNGSTDGTAARVREQFPEVAFIPLAGNRGAPAARNAGVARTRGEVLVVLDDDTRVEDPGFLDRIRRIFEDEPDASVVAFRILDAGTRRPRPFEIPCRRKERAEAPFETSYFISAGCAILRKVYEAVGGMDETLIYGFEELDFSYRAVSRGFRIFYRPEVWVLHHLSEEARPRWRRIYYFYRNKIWISARYLPWRMFCVQLAIWSAYFFKEALRIGRIDVFLAALATGLSGIPARLENRRHDKLPEGVLSRLRQIEGRLYY